MKVLFCSSEVAPFAKTGGLADVSGSLPVALGEIGVQVAVLMPKYRGIAFSRKKLSENVTVHFIEHEAYFNRHSLYGSEHGDYPDNLERFSFFCREALKTAKTLNFRPDILHAHDWQTALLPVILKTTLSQDPFFQKTRSLLTVHNLAYQGHFPASAYSALGLDPVLFSVDGFEFYGKINLLKAGLLNADALNTVSPTYAGEIKTREYGFGLEGVVRRREAALSGILNGIDTAVWNPSKDRRIKKTYSVENRAGKAACKEDLQRICGFEVDAGIPLFGMVTRLAEQKGMDLVSEIADKFLSERVQFVLLGEGDAAYRTAFANIGRRHPKNASVHLGFNAIEAHKIYAGADFFLMPSHFEPCGLGQMIAFRYGALPVVRRTGGLADTVIDADEDAPKGNGFSFAARSPEKLLAAIHRAVKVFNDKARFEKLRRRVMKLDFSWEKSAKSYKALYKGMLEGKLK